MKLGPLDISRNVTTATTPDESVANDAAPRKQISRAPTEKGASGTVNMQGFLQQEEYLSDLKGQQGLRIYDRMRRSDPDVREALGHISAPVRRALVNASVEPASDEPEDQEIAEMVRCTLFEWAETPWSRTVSQMLTMLPFGHSVFETCWQVVDAELEVTDPVTGEVESLPSRQFLVWERLAQRLVRTIWKWNVANGRLESIEQQTFKGEAWERITIPAEDLIIFTLEQEGDDYTGMSLIRSAYKPWMLKELIEKVSGMSVERHGVGTPIAYPSTEAQADDPIYDRLEAILQDHRSGEMNYIVAPGPKNMGRGDGLNGYTFEILSPAGGLPDFTGLLEYYRGAIKGSVLARFAELGHGSTGARATGDTQSEVWRDALKAILDEILGPLNQKLRGMVLKNYAVKRFPRVCAGDVDAKNLEEFANAISKLVAVGAVVPDDTFRGWTRTQIAAPDEDEVEEAGEAPEPDEDSPVYDPANPQLQLPIDPAVVKPDPPEPAA